MPGYLTLGQINLPTLAVSCSRCDRRGRLSVARLLAEHRPHFPVPELARIISADCGRRIAGKMHDPCGVCFPGLVGRERPENRVSAACQRLG